MDSFHFIWNSVYDDWDAFYKRIFWSVGPQFIGGLIGFMACEGFMVNVLGFTQFR